MEYLLFALILATLGIAGATLWRNRRKDPARSVDSFTRALKALNPERKGRRK